jgi:hypothetical protein
MSKKLRIKYKRKENDPFSQIFGVFVMRPNELSKGFEKRKNDVLIIPTDFSVLLLICR